MKKGLFFCIMILLLTFVFSTVYSVSCDYTMGQLKSSVKKFGAYIDEECNVRENVDGCLAAIGDSVNISSNVDGISFVLGDNVNLTGTTEYLFILGNTINLDTYITKDSVILGSSINIESENMLGRDSFILAETVSLSGEARRNVIITAETVKIHDAIISGDICINADKIIISGDTKILGTLSYYDNTNIDMANTVVVSNVDMMPSPVGNEDIVKNTFMQKVNNKIYSFGAIIVAILILAFVTPIFNKLDSTLVNKLSVGEILKTSLMGFLILCMTPIIVIVLLCTVVGIPIGLTILVLYIVGIWLSTIFAGYVLVKGMLKNKKIPTVIIAILALILMTLLGYLPMVGGIIKFISLVFGMGTYIYVFKKNRDKKIQISEIQEKKEDNQI